MGQFSTTNLYGMTIRESATDGSDFTNPDADYRRLFLGEDGLLHLKDSAGAVTDIGGAAGGIATDVIWDAAGDLAVGSGANTAAKLTKGADNTVLTISASTHVPVWAAPAGASVTATAMTQSTSSVTVANGSYTDITGVTASLAAGTYILFGEILWVTATTNGTAYYRVVDSGASTVYAEGENSGPTNGFRYQCALVGSFVLGSTTTVKLQVRADHSSSATKQDGGNGTAHVSTQVIAVKVA